MFLTISVIFSCIYRGMFSSHFVITRGNFSYIFCWCQNVYQVQTCPLIIVMVRIYLIDQLWLWVYVHIFEMAGVLFSNI